MSKNLLIVESPTKVRTIRKYLGNDFEVTASVGHLKDLPEDLFGVDLENNFQPTYVVIPGKEKVLKELKKKARSASAVYLAPDPDREGEAIAWHIAEELKKSRISAPIYRAVFHEITEKAVKNAIENPRQIDRNLVSAQQTRRIMDRIVGYMLSPFLWKKVKRGLSAGRVQSVAVRLVVEREREIQNFVPKEYWKIKGVFLTENGEFVTAYLKEGREGKIEIPSKEKAEKIAEEILSIGVGVVGKIEEKEVLRKPPPPFITSTLQQEASRRFGFSPKKTMQIAQDLYEGVEIGGEPVGLITYMRTDSTRLSPEILPEVREYIRERYGREFLPEEPLQYQPKKGSQDAHEAIRPTHLSLPPEKIQKELSKDHFRLYRLIWDRFVACQMKPAQYHRTTMDIQVGEYIFQVSGDILRFLGYLAVYEEGKDEEEGEKEKEERIPSLKEGERLEVKEVEKEQHFTKPPPRFSEATLIKELEAKGIGRPSTYATILSTILEKKYVKKEGGKLYPTELGTIVTDLLVKGFSRVMDVGFTAQMEKELDEVEEGKVEGVEVLQRFYLPFSEELRSAEKNLVSLKGEGLTTDLLCPVCGAPMRLKVGRYGEYLVCEKYPQCKTTRNVKRNEKGEIEMEGEVETGDLCPVCGSPLVQRKGKYGEFVRCKRYPECTYTAKGSSPVVMGSCKKCGGELRVMRTKEGGSRFLGCSRYPDCKYTEPFRTGVLCPKGCGGELVERKGRKGKPFWGCSSYPSCTYTLSREPVPFPCPRCNFPFLTRKDSSTFVCPEPSCGEEFPLETISKV